MPRLDESNYGARLGQKITQVKEREVFRTVLECSAPRSSALLSLIGECLKWAKKRSGAVIPRRAWEGHDFEILRGGRNLHGLSLEVEGYAVWALRAEDPDADIPGRVWTTEIVIHTKPNSDLVFCMRQVVSAGESNMEFVPHAPGIMMQVIRNCEFSDSGMHISDKPTTLNQENTDHILDFIESDDRKLPIILVSEDSRAISDEKLSVDPLRLSKAVAGIAHVYIAPEDITFSITERFGRARSVFHGGVRIYEPGFESNSDPYDHRLYVKSALIDRNHIETDIRYYMSLESVKRFRLDRDVYSFSSIRILKSDLDRKTINANASESERLESANKRILALEAEIKSTKEDAQKSWQTAFEEDERAKAAERELNSARIRIRSLEEALKKRVDNELNETSEDFPKKWELFADWADKTLIGKLVLLPAARRGTKRPQYQDPELTARAVAWLAEECRNRRMSGGGELANIPIGYGLENAPCGTDSFTVIYQTRRIEIDWHVKNGGNTRSPERCLRIYYGWDDVSEQIIVADLPAHRRSGAS